MSGWQTHNGLAVALASENVDTDQLIPARFMSTPRAQGYGKFLLHDLRQDDPDHVLNHAAATVLVTRRNFGSGSSREAAVYALLDFGIRAVFAPSFGDIFSANAVNNGLLPARLPDAQIETLLSDLAGNPAQAHIDLETGTAKIAGHEVSFALDAVSVEKLKNGWDDIDLTARHSGAIDAFFEGRKAKHRWMMPDRSHHEESGV